MENQNKNAFVYYSIDSLNTSIEMLQEFLLDLVCCRHRPDTVKDIANLQYYLLSKCQKNLEHLPPTVEALRQNVKRSYYVAYVQKHALDAHPFYPDPQMGILQMGIIRRYPCSNCN